MIVEEVRSEVNQQHRHMQRILDNQQRLFQRLGKFHYCLPVILMRQ